MPKRKGVFRTKMERKGKKLYAKREKTGEFKDIQNISKCVKGEIKQHSKKKVKSGYGFRGDTK